MKQDSTQAMWPLLLVLRCLFFFFFIGPIPWDHSGPLSRIVVVVVVVVVVVDIDVQAVCDSAGVRQ